MEICTDNNGKTTVCINKDDTDFLDKDLLDEMFEELSYPVYVLEGCRPRFLHKEECEEYQKIMEKEHGIVIPIKEMYYFGRPPYCINWEASKKDLQFVELTIEEYCEEMKKIMEN